MKRAIECSKLDREMNAELVETMWEQFHNLGLYEQNVIDTTNLSIADTVSIMIKVLSTKQVWIQCIVLPGLWAAQWKIYLSDNQNLWNKIYVYKHLSEDRW